MSEQKQKKVQISWKSSLNKCSMDVDVNNESFFMSIINFNKSLV